jgi:predicted RNA-binding protein YlxR (DUF448 family)
MENGKIRIRMCVVCRKRDFQDNLFRLQCIDKKLVPFSNKGRSFYVCKDCVNSKKFINYLSKKCSLTKEEVKKMIFYFPFYIED